MVSDWTHQKERFFIILQWNCRAGTGFIILGGVINNVIGIEAISERLCKIRIKSKYNNITMINMYAPTEDKVDAEKEKFYDDLQTVIEQKK